MLTRPVSLGFEKYVFNYYLKICGWIQTQLHTVSTLEQDLELLRSGEPDSANPAIPFELRMAIVYRSEKKKIIISQMNLIKKVLAVLDKAEGVLAAGDNDASSLAYKQLLLEETPAEVKWREKVENNLSMAEGEKEKELKALEESFYYRRIINATYFKQIKHLVLNREDSDELQVSSSAEPSSI